MKIAENDLESKTQGSVNFGKEL